MKQNSRRAWKLVKNLCGDPTKAEIMPPVTPDQVATQLLLNVCPFLPKWAAFILNAI